MHRAISFSSAPPKCVAHSHHVLPHISTYRRKCLVLAPPGLPNMSRTGCTYRALSSIRPRRPARVVGPYLHVPMRVVASRLSAFVAGIARIVPFGEEKCLMHSALGGVSRIRASNAIHALSRRHRCSLRPLTAPILPPTCDPQDCSPGTGPSLGRVCRCRRCCRVRGGRGAGRGGQAAPCGRKGPTQAQAWSRPDHEGRRADRRTGVQRCRRLCD